MLPSELKLASLGHCHVHLPETFVSRRPAVKGGAVISIKSIQSDHELFVVWDGQLTSGEHVELDLVFAKANKLTDELVIISSLDNVDVTDCTSCRVELLDQSDLAILSNHTELDLLDACKLIFNDLTIPIKVSQNVRVLVRVSSFEPSDRPLALLSRRTELCFVHQSSHIPDLPSNNRRPDDKEQSVNPSVPFLSCALGCEAYKPKFYFGSMLIVGERGSGKTHYLKQLLKDYKCYHGEYFNCKQLRGKRPENVKKTLAELVSRALEKAQQAAIIALDDIDSFLEFDAKLLDERGQEVLYKRRLISQFCIFLKQLERKEFIEDPDRCKINLVVVASCRSLSSLDKRISEPIGRPYFAHIKYIKSPNLAERIAILKNIFSENQQVECSLSDSEVETIARGCPSFTPADLRRLYERALINACSRTNLAFSPEPIVVEYEDFPDSINNYTPINLRNVSLQPKKELRTFDDVGGMGAIKNMLMKTILLPLKYPKLFKKCPLKPQNSILLFGPPGCGKTLIAEAVCNQDNLNSICVSGPELLSKYIGASEAAVRDLFRRAQLAKPCLIFFDEFESLVAKRGADSTGVTDRIVNQFLTILDGVDSLGNDVFILAATTRPDMIDPAMLRPGRLDKHIYCPLPDEQDRLEILRTLAKTMDLEDDIEFVEWSKKTECFTGADIQSLLCSAQLKALNELIEGSQCQKQSINNESPQEPSPRTEIVIRVSLKHLVESWEESNSKIRSNYKSIIENYPPNVFGITKRIAVKATLA